MPKCFVMVRSRPWTPTQAAISRREFTQAMNLQGDLLTLSLMSSRKFVDEFEKRVEPLLLIFHFNVTKNVIQIESSVLRGFCVPFLHEVLSAINYHKLIVVRCIEGTKYLDISFHFNFTIHFIHAGRTKHIKWMFWPNKPQIQWFDGLNDKEH